MSKGDNRLKIFYILDELKSNSKLKSSDDKSRFLSATALIETLNQKHNLDADRKSIYSYIESLIKYGYDIEKSRRGYYLQEHYNGYDDESSLELPELKIITDALSASKFISAKKTQTIINKLEKLADDSNEELHNRRVYFEKALKSDDLSVIYNIDAIHSAIIEHKKISFKYQMVCADLDINNSKLMIINKKDELGNDKQYLQSPYALVWKNECYYLICYDSESKAPKTFRVDRMKDVTVCSDRRDGIYFFEEFNISDYVNTAFSTFGGETINIVLRVKNELAGVIADRFGKDIGVYQDDTEGYFRCSVNVQKSRQFYSWLSGFGGDIELVFPHTVKTDYLHYLEGIILSYSS